MAKQRTWNVLELGIEPKETILLDCPGCGVEAAMPIEDTSKNPIIAANGLMLIYDRPWDMPKKSQLPITFKCRYCRRTYTTRKESDE